MKHPSLPNIIAILAIFCTCQSCGFGNEIQFFITNNTKYKIDSIAMEPDDKTVHQFIAPGETVEYVVEMNKTPKADGSYLLKYTLNGKKFSQRFGYYSNGAPLQTGGNITISEQAAEIQFNKY